MVSFYRYIFLCTGYPRRKCSIRVFAQTISYGSKQGLIASAGFAFASGLNIIIVMTGLGIILSQSVIYRHPRWVDNKRFHL